MPLECLKFDDFIPGSYNEVAVFARETRQQSPSGAAASLDTSYVITLLSATTLGFYTAGKMLT